MKTSKDQKNSIAVKSLRERKIQAAQTTKWLHDNYCACSDVCLPRGIVYDHYLDFCRAENISPACKATFGKLIRSSFPEVTSKRLGARGHSKYHYNGIGIKSSSGHYAALPESTGFTRFSKSDTKPEAGASPKRFSLATKVGTILPKFPDVEEFELPPALNKEKLKVFLTMYRTHCQCIVDTATSRNLEEIRVFLLHFWQGFPEHLMFLVHMKMVVDIISVCDWILCRTLLDVLFPSSMCEMSESLLCDIQNLGRQWENWLRASLENMPTKLLHAKISTAKVFKKSLKRYVAFLHLAQVIRPLLNDDVASICDDMDRFYLKWTCFENFPDIVDDDVVLSDFQNQLRLSPTVDTLTSWLDAIVEDKIFKDGDSTAFIPKASIFLLQWIFTFNRLSYFFTLIKSRHFTLFHLISTFLQEYLFLAVEDQLGKMEERKIYCNLKTHLKNSANFTENRSLIEVYNSPTSCFLVKYQKKDWRQMKVPHNPVIVDFQKEDISEKFQRYRSLAEDICYANPRIAPTEQNFRNFSSQDSGAQLNYSQFPGECDLSGLKQYPHNHNADVSTNFGNSSCAHHQQTQFFSHLNYVNGNQQIKYNASNENPFVPNFGLPMSEQTASTPCHPTENEFLYHNHAGLTAPISEARVFEDVCLPMQIMPIL